MSDTGVLLAWMRTQPGDVPLRAIGENGPRAFRRKADAEPALAALVAAGRLVEVSRRPRAFRVVRPGTAPGRSGSKVLDMLADAAAEHQLRGNAAVGAAHEGGEGALALGGGGAAGGADFRPEGRVRHEPLVAVLQRAQRLVGRHLGLEAFRRGEGGRRGEAGGEKPGGRGHEPAAPSGAVSVGGAVAAKAVVHDSPRLGAANTAP